jgi:hypothetical protein
MSNSRCFKLLPSQLPVLHPADDQTAGPFRFHPNLPFLVADHRSQLAFGPPIEIFIFSFLQDMKKQSFPRKFSDRGALFQSVSFYHCPKMRHFPTLLICWRYVEMVSSKRLSQP